MKLEVGKSYRTTEGERIDIREKRDTAFRPFIIEAGDGRCWNEDGTANKPQWNIVAPWGVIEGPGPYVTASGSRVEVAAKSPHPSAPGFDWLVCMSDGAVQRYSDEGKSFYGVYVDIVGPRAEKKYRPLTPVEAAQNFKRGVQYAKDEYATGNRWFLHAVESSGDAEIAWVSGPGNTQSVPLSRLATAYVWSDTNEPCGVEVS